MINFRRLVILILGAMLVAAPLVRSQDWNRSEAMLRVASAPVLGLQPHRVIGLPAGPVSAPVTGARDLSRYREFQFGETLPALAKQVGVEPSAARLIHTRPAVIQELEWPAWLAGGSSSPTDPVRNILFSFYNGELFRIVVNYNQGETEGLTTEDVIEAISAKYGTATVPAGATVAFSSTQVYNDREIVIARWENSRYSFNLYRSTYQPTFGMIAFAKSSDALARSATTEAIRLDAQATPRTETERQPSEGGNNRELLEQARQVNKRNFRL